MVHAMTPTALCHVKVGGRTILGEGERELLGSGRKELKHWSHAEGSLATADTNSPAGVGEANGRLGKHVSELGRGL